MDIRNFLQKPGVAPVAAGLLGLGLGSGLTYLRMRHQMIKVAGYVEETLEAIDLETERLDKERRRIEAMKDQLDRGIISRDDVLPPYPDTGDSPRRDFGTIEARKALMDGHPSMVDAARAMELTPLEELAPDAEEVQVEVTERKGPVAVGIFRRAEDNGWDYDTEMQKRTDDAPYVIHKDEFFGDEMEWDSQSTLTYYVGDDVLADQNDVPIYDIADTIGEVKFGHGSGDPNVFYVRDPRKHCEYEILRHTGQFSVEVLGNTIEHGYEQGDLRHMHAPGKFRDF